MILCVPDAYLGLLPYDGSKSSFTCWLPREAAETNERFRQIIPYVAVVNSRAEYLTYSRKGNEQRLHGYRSFGIGGHIEQTDFSIESAARRELNEETRAASEWILTPLGKISLDAEPVDRVHVALAFITESDLIDIGNVNEEELLDPKWESLSSIAENLGDYEPWSRELYRLVTNRF